MAYDHQSIEAKWQQIWEDEKTFEAFEDESRPKFYNVAMYPYPSGDLHVGHLRNYTYIDLVTRYKMMQGYNVLSPMGWDSFGLPAENRAIETGVHPSESVSSQIDAMKVHFRQLGAGFDWQRELASHWPSYYQWDQWLFIQLFDRGLAYKKEAPVNWCPQDQTVLANEQVVEGACERCGTIVEKKNLAQWFFKITDFADRLLNDLDQLDEWPDRVRTMQRNWIGRSTGAQFSLAVDDSTDSFEVFTTRPDTIFGMTFAVLAPEHPLVDRLISGTDQEADARRYMTAAGRASEIERLSEGAKSGVFTGRHVINPVNGARVPIYIADYVLMGYGTGAIMAVPGQDQRDWEFATRYGIDIIRTVQPPAGYDGEAFTGDGVTINSDFLNGLSRGEAIDSMIKWFEAEGLGTATVNYRLRDWLISRQRYWGAPIPIVSCPACGLVAVPDDELPVLLPDVPDYAPKGQSPLAALEDWVATTCPSCGGGARRETDTMDTFVDSAWYFFRYTDPHNAGQIFDPEKARYWMPIDQYIGGVEHAVLHLLYARFITKFLFDVGLSSVEEPFARLFTQGMITLNGAKMSKSKGNVIPPDRYYREFGADAMRLFELFVGPPTDDAVWNDNGVAGTARFLDRVWKMGTESNDYIDRAEDDRDRALIADTHRAISKVTDDLDRFHFNTTVPVLMTLANTMTDYLADGPREETFKAAYAAMVFMLSPMAPHIAHELWERTGHDTMLATEPWPVADARLLERSTVTMVIQVNGKLRDRVDVDADIDAGDAERLALESDKISQWIDGQAVKRIIVREPNLVNIVVD
ncbi:MAG TPA: leucine--tRNA ligase [Acidimicrobiia bacterium]